MNLYILCVAKSLIKRITQKSCFVSGAIIKGVVIEIQGGDRPPTLIMALIVPYSHIIRCLRLYFHRKEMDKDHHLIKDHRL